MCVLYWVAVRHQLLCLLGHKKSITWGPFSGSRANAWSKLIWCMETLITYCMYLFWHGRIWQRLLRQIFMANQYYAHLRLYFNCYVQQADSILKTFCAKITKIASSVSRAKYIILMRKSSAIPRGILCVNVCRLFIEIWHWLIWRLTADFMLAWFEKLIISGVGLKAKLSVSEIHFVKCIMAQPAAFNSLWPNDTKCRYKYG